MQHLGNGPAGYNFVWLGNTSRECVSPLVRRQREPEALQGAPDISLTDLVPSVGVRPTLVAGPVALRTMMGGGVGQRLCVETLRFVLLSS